MSRLARLYNLVFPVGIIACLLVILIPLPPQLMDLLLAANITVAVIVLLTTIYVSTPLEFSVFPSLLLATTLARLVLNIATTRLILTRAESDGLLAAGSVVKNFGEFVAGDRIVVGLIIFTIIVVIQFVVITKGATRISEVAARFALDGMPGRQMAIDADLNAGVIDEHEAGRRRDEVNRQADFYGAMDGASKFVRGDAIAGVVITLVNIAGGLVIGLWEAGMTLAEAGSVFTKLTIGDGLVSQLPALLISLAAGLLLTRSSQRVNLPNEFLTQLFSRPQALAVAGGFLVMLLFTQLPAVPLVFLGSGCFGLALLLSRQQQAEVAKTTDTGQSSAAPARPEPDRIEDYLAVDPMELEIGVGLIPLVDPKRGGHLLQRIMRIRQGVAGDIGIVVPKVRVRDNMGLGRYQFRVKIANDPVREEVVFPDKLLAVASGEAADQLPGEETYDPPSGRPAVWIDTAVRPQAEDLGYRIVDPTTVLGDHLHEVVRSHADELLTRDAVRQLIDELRKVAPAAVDELIPKVMQLGDVQQVLQRLLREDVPIRQLGLILEVLGDCAGRTNDPAQLVEFVRQRLARTISSRYRDGDKRLHAVTLDPDWEDQIAACQEHSEHGVRARLPRTATDDLCQSIADEAAKLRAVGRPSLLLVSANIRQGVRQITASRLPRLVVLSYDEITRDTKIAAVGIVSGAGERG